MNNRYFLSSTDFDFKGKTVLVRIDCDVDVVAAASAEASASQRGFEGLPAGRQVDEDFRLRSALPTIKFLQGKGVSKIILMGHMGRPEGKMVDELKLEPVGRKINQLLESNFPYRVNKFQISNFKTIFNFSISNLENVYQIDTNIFLLENLRFNKGEEENDKSFSKSLSEIGDIYVNEAFGVSHREHASIVGIPKFLPSFLGLRFEGEVKVLGDLREQAKRPLIFILGGSKKDKLDYLEFLGEWCDKVVVGGKLPLLPNFKFLIFNLNSNFKFLISNLKNNGKDIDDESIEKAIETIKTAKTLVWAGPMGVYEEKENEKGTFAVAQAIAETGAFKVAGGGDTHKVLSMLNLWDKFDFVSVGGGAMLYFLKSGTLPGIEAIKK